MMAIRIPRPGEVRLVEAAEPAPPPGWVRVAVRAAAICATDFELLRGSIAAAYPVTPGHEWSGVVEAAGSADGERWLGRRVTGDNEITCGECRYCRRGEWRRCPEYRQIGFAAPGAYAEKMLVPVRNLYELPEAVSFEQGALLEPMGVGIAVAAMAGARIGSTAAVLGCGPIGLNALAALLRSGARRVLCLDRKPARLNLALRWGACRAAASTAELGSFAMELHPHGTDIVVEATGDPDIVQFGAELARFGGAFVLAGYSHGRQIAFRPDTVHERNVRVLGAGNNCGFIETAVEAAGDGLLRTEEMITHRFRLDQYRTALAEDTIAECGFVKGLFVFD